MFIGHEGCPLVIICGLWSGIRLELNVILSRLVLSVTVWFLNLVHSGFPMYGFRLWLVDMMPTSMTREYVEVYVLLLLDMSRCARTYATNIQTIDYIIWVNVLPICDRLRNLISELINDDLKWDSRIAGVRLWLHGTMCAWSTSSSC